MENVLWITSPLKNAAYYKDKLAELKAREKSRKGQASPIDLKVYNQAVQELTELIKTLD